ncbi:hypothetical protein GQ42DRAFT_160954, partial [Ramicandelaber brevisporus]
MFHLLPSSWFVPLPLAFSPTSCLLSLVVGCHQVKVVALAASTCSPVAVAMLCFFPRSVW